MDFTRKIFQELVTEFKLPNNKVYIRKNVQSDFFNSRDMFLEKLTRQQKKEFNELSRKALLVAFYELNKYYNLGYDDANKKNDV